jgi:hypothetical protein
VHLADDRIAGDAAGQLRRDLAGAQPFSPHLLQLFDAVFCPGQLLVGVWLFVLLAQG